MAVRHGRHAHTQPFLANATMLSVERQKVITMARIADVWPLLLLNPRHLEGGPAAAACLRARDKVFSFSIYLSICLSIYLSMCVIHIRTYTLMYIQAAEEKRKAEEAKRKVLCAP